MTINRYEASDALKLFASWIWHNADLPFDGPVTLWQHYNRPVLDVWPLLSGTHTAEEHVAAVQAWADRLGAEAVPEEPAADGSMSWRVETTIGGSGDDRPVDIRVTCLVAATPAEAVSA